MLITRTIVTLGSLSLTLAAHHSAESLLDSSFDDAAEYLLDALHVPGLSVAVVYDGEIKAKGYGFSQLPATPATPDTLWFTGSTTKAFTAAAIGKIIQGHTNITGLKWSTPLSEILGSDFVLRDEYANSHISIEDAMSHRSGLPRHDDAYGWGNSSTTDILRTMRDLPFSAQPRTKWQYNNLMFAAIGEAISRLTEQSLETTLRKWLWEPLGMRSTTFAIDEADARQDSHGRSRLARGYFWEGSHYVPDRWIDIIPLAGAGATISSVNDYALWARALLHAHSGSPNHTSPIDGNLYKALTTPRSIITDLDNGAYSPTYALGWIIVHVGGKLVVTHSGGLPGFGTQLFLVPEFGLAFVGVGNTAGTSAAVAASLFVNILHRVADIEAASKDKHIEDIRQLSNLASPQTRTCNISIRRTSHDGSLPLPGVISDYTGLYAHPAYGMFNVSHSRPSSSLTSLFSSTQQQPLLASGSSLLVTPSPRSWSNVYHLTHSTHSSFDMNIYGIHGPAPSGDDPCEGGKAKGRKLECKNEKIAELFGGGSAVFERGIDGQAERLGLEIEEELVRWSEELGGDKNWREGMIWLEKVK